MEDLNEEYGLSSFENFYDKFLGNSMKQANEKNQEWRDAQDVEKALIDYCHGQEPSHRFSPITILDLRAFAKFYAQRCGIEVGNECVHCHKSKLIENGVCNCCGGEQ